MIEGHGDDGWKYAKPLRADFSSNVFYGPLDTGLQAHLRNSIDTVTHYPEAGATSLQAAAAAAYDVHPNSVLATNGATEAIYLIAQAFRPMPVTIIGPAFAEYADACTLQGMPVRHISQKEWQDSELSGLIFICNPNNPTGHALPAEQLAQAADRHPAAIFVIDESYIDFTLATGSIISTRRPNVLVLRSLTKSCRTPGLRIGFLIGPEDLVASVAAYKMPWSVNRLAIEAGLYIFQHREQFTVPIASLLVATTTWRQQLAAATGWQMADTDTHYFLMETPAAFTAAQLKLHLVSRYGLLIRDAANFMGLTPHHFRVAGQSPEENNLLTQALHECSRAGI